MRITLFFQFNDQDKPAAITGVDGAVTDLILPCVGDLVRHRDAKGIAFTGNVTQRVYSYDLVDGPNVDGSVEVVICMERVTSS